MISWLEYSHPVGLGVLGKGERQNRSLFLKRLISKIKHKG